MLKKLFFAMASSPKKTLETVGTFKFVVGKHPKYYDENGWLADPLFYGFSLEVSQPIQGIGEYAYGELLEQDWVDVVGLFCTNGNWAFFVIAFGAAYATGMGFGENDIVVKLKGITYDVSNRLKINDDLMSYSLRNENKDKPILDVGEIVEVEVLKWS